MLTYQLEEKKSNWKKIKKHFPKNRHTPAFLGEYPIPEQYMGV
ncbi:hypothetical protein HK1_00430 [Tepidibacillus sp. HK-1]|nr:hypothetical protein HK1_00430 [Tepidibacillus sp. HK-1]